MRVAKRRCAIARRNLELCFPALSNAELERLLRENIYSTALAVFETGIAWFWSRRRVEKLFHFQHLEILRDLQTQGQGAILLVLHFTTLEMWASGFCGAINNIDITYRPHDNPVYDLLQHWRRRHHNKSSEVVAAGDVRAMAKSLRAGRLLAYFPDQDYGPAMSTFAPFYGIPSATIVGLSRLASMGNAVVVPLMCERRADQTGYDYQVMSPWQSYPSGDDLLDATRLNEHVEACVNRVPDQYLWVHRRFKTRPLGEPPVYGD